MFGIVVEYEYSGNEDEWQEVVETFLGHVKADTRLQGCFSYQVNIRKDGAGRIHIGQWDTDKTLAHLQSQPYFKAFASRIQAFGGDSLRPSPFRTVAATEPAH